MSSFDTCNRVEGWWRLHKKDLQLVNVISTATDDGQPPNWYPINLVWSEGWKRSAIGVESFSQTKYLSKALTLIGRDERNVNMAVECVCPSVHSFSSFLYLNAGYVYMKDRMCVCFS